MQPAVMDLFSSIRGFFVGQRHQLVQSQPSFFAIALFSTSTASTLLVHRNHLTFDLIEVQDQQLTGQQQCTNQNYFYALKPVLQPAIMDLFTSISEFFVGQRHQLVQPLFSSIAIVLILTSTASTLLVHRNHPTFDLIEIQDHQLIRQQQCTTQNKIFAPALTRRGATSAGFAGALIKCPGDCLLLNPVGAKQVRYANGGGMNAK